MPFAYKRIWNKSIFSLHGQKELYIKHSDAVAFDIDGNPHVFSGYDVCWPKRVTPEEYKQFMEHCHKHDEEVLSYMGGK